ncbi:MAG: hypothetical protein UT36_C0015G0011 [Candidatus Peregrinibacteria bacterium GW2011_GWF2_39_17]|nr:MAG: hypothetical protein UT36_C0015G0011 [Candidatus Peregrinibacteria bacterium GW2011_GWF2_39_17]HCW32037.1 hypothetical protein [Candidatus Peregrinibacteria bacterium]
MFTPNRFIYRQIPKAAREKAAISPTASKKPPKILEDAKSQLEKLGENVDTLEQKRGILIELIKSEIAKKEANQPHQVEALKKMLLSAYVTPKRTGIQKKYDKLIAALPARSGDFAEQKARLLTQLEVELYRFEVEAIVNFELLPDHEKALIRDGIEANKKAERLYISEAVRKSSPNLYIGREKRMRIESVKAPSITKQDQIEGPTDIFVDLSKYSDLLELNNDHVPRGLRTGDPEYPDERIFNREVALRFLERNGAELIPQARAKIYVDVARSLLYQDTKEYNPKLAAKYLDKALSFLEDMTEVFHLSPEGDTTFYLQDYANFLRAQADDGVLQSDKFYRRALHLYRYPNIETQGPNFNKEILETYTEYLIQQDIAILIFWLCQDYEKFYKGNSKGQQKLIESILPLRERVVNYYLQKAYEEPDPAESQRLLARGSNILRNTLQISYYRNNKDIRWERDSLEFLNFWRGEQITEAQKIEKLKSKGYLPDDPDLINRYKNSPFTAKEYQALIGINSKNESVGQWEKDLHFLKTRRGVDWKLMQARLLDDWSPPGFSPNRQKALGYYREVLGGLSNKDTQLVVARCYGIVNRPPQGINDPATKEFSPITSDGLLVKGREIKFGTAEATLENPKENFVILYYNPETKLGVGINRYLNLPEPSLWDPRFKGKLAERKRLMTEYTALDKKISGIHANLDSLQQRIETASALEKPRFKKQYYEQNLLKTNFVNQRDKIKANLDKVNSELRPEGAGGIYRFLKNEKGQVEILADIGSFDEHGVPQLKNWTDNYPASGGFTPRNLGIEEWDLQYWGKNRLFVYPLTDSDGAPVLLDEKGQIKR